LPNKFLLGRKGKESIPVRKKIIFITEKESDEIRVIDVEFIQLMG
jgi:hypothetical protein